jgi:hypothetical protein
VTVSKPLDGAPPLSTLRLPTTERGRNGSAKVEQDASRVIRKKKSFLDFSGRPARLAGPGKSGPSHRSLKTESETSHRVMGGSRRLFGVGNRTKSFDGFDHKRINAHSFNWRV